MKSPDRPPLNREAVQIVGELVDYRQAHASGAALDNLHCGLNVESVQVFNFGLRDLSDLGAFDTPDHLKTCSARTLFDASCFTQKV